MHSLHRSIYGPSSSTREVTNDASKPNKHIGFLNHYPAKFTFMDPGRAPVTIDLIGKCPKGADIIRETTLPNYDQTRIPLGSDLNIADWEYNLQDQMILQYLKFGFPLSFPKECHHKIGWKYLSKKKFQSLLGKLIYLHKCVIPARIFINRMLDLFRSNDKTGIYLSTEFLRTFIG